MFSLISVEYVCLVMDHCPSRAVFVEQLLAYGIYQNYGISGNKSVLYRIEFKNYRCLLKSRAKEHVGLRTVSNDPSAG